MIDLLSKRDQRIVRILDHLVDTRKTSLQALSKGSKVPERTLWGDIQRINEMCAPARVAATSDGVELVIPSEYNERYLFDQIMVDSTELNMLESIFLQKVWSIADLADMFYLSEVTIRRMIRQMNLALRAYGIKITSNPLEITGDVQSIIQLFTMYFLEKYNRVNYFMHQEEVNAIELLFHHIDLTEKLIQNNQDFNLYVLKFFVRLKYLMGTPQDTVDEDIADYVHDYEAVNQKFRSAFGVRLSPSIIHFCIPYLFDNRSIASSVSELETMITQKQDHALYCQVVDFLNQFIETNGMQFVCYDELVVTLFNVLKDARMIPFIVYDRDRHFVSHLELYNPILVRQAKDHYALNFRKKKHQMVLYHVLYTFLTHWEGLITLFKKRDQAIEVAIFFDSDLEHAVFAKEVLMHEFGEHIHFEVLDYRTYEDLIKNLKQYDVLITNKPGLKSDVCEILCLDEFFLEESWADLRGKLLHAESQILMNRESIKENA